MVITAVLAGSSQSQVARAYGVSQSWISRLMARYAVEGEAAFEPRSRRPHTSPRATPPGTVELELRLRKQLSEDGLDAGAVRLEGSAQDADPHPGHAPAARYEVVKRSRPLSRYRVRSSGSPGS